ncbi:MAG: hypothetical protein EA358_00740, partial [Flavobacteriales bacterium]
HNELIDFSTTQPGGNYGLREACDELLILANSMENVVQLRMKTSGEYTEYLQERNTITTNK